MYGTVVSSKSGFAGITIKDFRFMVPCISDNNNE
jgi:hypothetical protein